MEDQTLIDNKIVFIITGLVILGAYLLNKYLNSDTVPFKTIKKRGKKINNTENDYIMVDNETETVTKKSYDNLPQKTQMLENKPIMETYESLLQNTDIEKIVITHKTKLIGYV